MSHHEEPGKTDEWYTPKYIFDAMGVHFDDDVASPGREITPWIPARRFITKKDQWAWSGFVWMNPPFGGRNGIVPWLTRFVEHGCGVALTPDRTSAPWWQEFAPQMGHILFVSPKIKFIGPDGRPGKSPSCGTTLMALGGAGERALEYAHRNGLGVIF